LATRPISARTRRAAVEFGEHVRTWRKLQGLTAEQVAERAGVNRNTLGRLERGELTVGFDVVLNVARALGQLDRLVEALDPYESDLGRARADQALPTRVRR
jgi:transcriptional regulator with XRE-family HTH domain